MNTTEIERIFGMLDMVLMMCIKIVGQSVSSYLVCSNDLRRVFLPTNNVVKFSISTFPDFL